MRHCVTLPRVDTPEEPLYLARMAGPRPRNPRWRLLAAAGVGLALVLLAAALLIDRDRRPAAAPAATAASTSPAAPSPVVLSTSPAMQVTDAAAVDACGRASKANGEAAYDPAKMRPIGQRAAESAVPAVHIQGVRLAELAERAARSGKAADALEMSTVVKDLAVYCLNNGLATA